MKQRISKKTKSSTKPSTKRSTKRLKYPKHPKHPTSLSSAEADGDVIEVHNSINAASQNEMNGRAVRRSVRNRRRSQKIAEDKKEKTPTARPVKNHDFCDACGESGRLICCDGCPNVYHFDCTEPPIHNVEELEDTWYCKTCEQKRSKGKGTSGTKTTTTGDSLFEGLMDNLHGENSKSYRLSESIYGDFKNVSSDRYGEYVDTSAVKRVKFKNREPILPDYHQLKADDGTPVQCYHCRKSALVQAIIKCDFCPLYWHLDCLDPPLTIPPNIARKWMCPLHIEHSIKPPRKRKSAASNIADIDPNAPASAYMNYLTDIIDDQPVKKQKNTPVSDQVPFSEDSVTNKNGEVYGPPETPFNFTFSFSAARDSVLQSQHCNVQQQQQQQQPSTSASTSTSTPASTSTSTPASTSTSTPASTSSATPASTSSATPASTSSATPASTSSVTPASTLSPTSASTLSSEARAALEATLDAALAKAASFESTREEASAALEEAGLAAVALAFSSPEVVAAEAAAYEAAERAGRALIAAATASQAVDENKRRLSILSSSESTGTSSKSEANTPPLVHTSRVTTQKDTSEHQLLPKQTNMNDIDEETEAWLESLALLKSGHR